MNDRIAHILSQNSKDQAFLVVGWGTTGKAVSDYLSASKKYHYIYDDQQKDLQQGEYCLGCVDQQNLQQIFLRHGIVAVFPSPGVALTHPVVQMADKNGVPILGELELAGVQLKGDFIAVTGTNGKSTTVMLIHALLENAGKPNGLKGNIGSALITAVSEPPKPFYVIEESSYQLELIGSIRHRVAVCLNVTDDHLDRYKDLRGYALAKQNIIRNSLKDDVFIYNIDDRECIRMAREATCRVVPFSLLNPQTEGGWVDGETMKIRLGGREFAFPLSECRLKGMHNLENMLASLLSVLVIDASETAVQSYRHTLKTFAGLPHRLELIATSRGVEFYDDSKATNVGSVVMALASFDRPILLIAGGRDKQGDYAPMKGLVRGKVRKMYLIGEAKDKMKQVFENDTEIVMAGTMDVAVKQAVADANEGDVVLLSPACSSFDQFRDYAHRAEEFKQFVKRYTEHVL